jgi:hypothetical protein
MTFQIFGLNAAASMVVVIAIAWAAAVIVVLLILLIVAMVRKCCREQTPEKPTANVTDKLIPPLYYTEEIKDPLQQDDLYEGAHLRV